MTQTAIKTDLKLAHCLIAGEAFQIAETAWAAAYEAVCPRGTWPGDFRYSDAAKGAPGSALRAAYDERCRASAAWHDAIAMRAK